MSGRLIALIGAAVCATLSGDDLSDRAKLTGTWSDKDAGLTWVVEQKGDSIHITQSHNDQQLSQVECNVDGHECQVKDASHTTKVMMWFSGPKLVQMETKGSEVIKRQFSASDDSLEIEVIPIVPDGKPQVVKLKRIKLAAARQ